MGSGELTATMVEVHKEVIGRLGSAPKAFFLDTPAGFQLNADQLSRKAVEYFRTKVGYEMGIISFKSADIPAIDAERAFRTINEADYLLVGPGSPTYAVRQWQKSPIPEILKRRIEGGGCLAAASAAALATGRFTLPVYEIYKVGEEPRWSEGLDILGHFGLKVVVIPHWNNAEGGSHDTRFCFMGEKRFKALEAMLPDDIGVLGLDEHTACIIDFGLGELSIKGIGKVTLRRRSAERTFSRGERFPLNMLSPEAVEPSRDNIPAPEPSLPAEPESFRDTTHALEAEFHKGLREEKRDLFAPLVDELLALRNRFRENNQWNEADAVRDCLKKVGVEVDDTKEGSRWHMSR
jgi:peptidase E